MGDLTGPGRDQIVRFCNYQMRTNPAGIGNECTHFVYAALFEARAMDGALEHNGQVQTSAMPYRWGRALQPGDTVPGDVVQFQNERQVALTYSSRAHNTHQDLRIRGPRHTGIMRTGALWGDYQQYESHLHQQGVPIMQIRVNRVFYESYAIAISDSAFQANSSLMAFVRQHAGNAQDLFEAVNWGALRRSFGIGAHQAHPIAQQLHAGTEPAGIAVFFQVTITGGIRFFRPQLSNRRAAMTRTERAAEKQRLIRMMERTGRAGTSDPADPYGGDERAQRIRDHRFDWSFPESEWR